MLGHDILLASLKVLVSRRASNFGEETLLIHEEERIEPLWWDGDPFVEGVHIRLEGVLRVDIGTPRERVRFRAESPGSVLDRKVEIGQIFRPASLSSTQLLGRGEVL